MGPRPLGSRISSPRKAPRLNVRSLDRADADDSRPAVFGPSFFSQLPLPRVRPPVGQKKTPLPPIPGSTALKAYPAPLQRAFTLLELLAVMALIAILAGFLVPVVSHVMIEGRATKCLSNLKQLGASAMLYAGDNDMTLPVTVHQRRAGGKSWTITLQEYAGGTLIFRCPDDKDRVRTYTYVLNDYLTPNPSGAPLLDFSKISRLETPSETILFTEAAEQYANSDHFHFSDYYGQTIPAVVLKAQIAVERHGGSANYVFADGHAEKVSWEKLYDRLDLPGSRLLDPTREK